MDGRNMLLASSRALKLFFLFALILAPCSATAAFAEDARPPTDNATEGNASVGYFFAADSKGNPVFTQVLSWDADPNALQFEITIRDASGAQITHEFTEANSFSMQLSPGDYSCNIVTWNLLGQPEIETGWENLTVTKAEMPSLSSVSPTFLFLDSMNGKITLKGHLLSSGAKVYLRDQLGHKLYGNEVSRVDDTEIVVAFPDKDLVTGTFDVVVVNPGGLSANEKNAIHVMFEHPLDIILTAGYSPVLFLQDSWFKENWTDPVYWIGANAGLSVYFYKKSWGFLGIEAAASVHRITGGDSQATLTSDYLLSGCNFLYKYRFSKAFFGLARAGGGIAFSRHSFDYKGTEGPSTNSSNLYLDTGIAFQYLFSQKFFAELGADWIEIFENGHAIGGVRPAIKIGWQIF